MTVPALKTVDIGGGRQISYREAGTGTPVVILHGLGGRSESWEPQYKGLSDNYHVIGWDAPGYNESSEMSELEPAISDYVEIVKRFTDALQLDQFHLVGHSVGTCLSAGFHKAYPEQLFSLTLAEAVIGNGGDTKERQHAAIAARAKDFEEFGAEEVARKKTPNSLSPNANAATIKAAIAFASKVKIPGHLKLAGALIRGNIFDFIAPLNCPGLIIAGSDDRSAPAEFVKQIADAYPGIEYKMIDGIGHQIAFEKPEIFVKLLNDHLEKAEEAV
tara:strand:+ start:37 stop:858 length:822 start_codon:yes stop_codon:yes gene_type:complete